MKSMGVLPSNDKKLVHASSILPKDSYIDFLSSGRNLAFTPYRAKQQAAGTTMPQDSLKKAKTRCCPIADEEDDDDYEAYMLRVERQRAEQKESLAKQVIEPESNMKIMATSRRVHWLSGEDTKDYKLAKQVIEPKTKTKKLAFKGGHSSSELLIIEPKTKMMNKTSSKRSHSPTEENEDYHRLAKDDIEPKTKKNKVTSNGSHYSPTVDDEVAEPKPKKKNKATSSKSSRSPVNYEDDEDYELSKKTAEQKAKKKKATSSKRSHSSTEDEYDDENDKEMKKLKRKRQKEIEKELNSKPPITNDVTDRLNEFITSDAINGTDITLVIQKLLYISDLKRNQNRLAMPINQLRTLAFLTPQEKEMLEDKNSNGLDVQLVGPELQIYHKPMNLARWKMETTQNYVLKTHWNEFVADHGEDLIENSIIQVWSFRKNNELCFALAIVERPKPMFFDNQDYSPSSS